MFMFYLSQFITFFVTNHMILEIIIIHANYLYCFHFVVFRPDFLGNNKWLEYCGLLTLIGFIYVRIHLYLLSILYMKIKNWLVILSSRLMKTILYVYFSIAVVIIWIFLGKILLQYVISVWQFFWTVLNLLFFCLFRQQLHAFHETKSKIYYFIFFELNSKNL